MRPHFAESRGRKEGVMNIKTMEGLAGAGTNMKLLNVPMRVYKEARRRGDTAAMDRAMGYARDCADQAQEYQETAEEGMKEDAVESGERLEQARSELVQRQKEKQEETKRQTEEGWTIQDTVELSPEGIAMQKSLQEMHNSTDISKRIIQEEQSNETGGN